MRSPSAGMNPYPGDSAVDQDAIIGALESALRGKEPRMTAPLWLGWLVVCLCRQRVRQSWLMHVHLTHLKGVEERWGFVPGLPGWSYRYHGIGLCLTGPGNEVLDVDFHDQVGAIISPFFFARRVMGLDPAPPPGGLPAACQRRDGCLRALDRGPRGLDDRRRRGGAWRPASIEPDCNRGPAPAPRPAKTPPVSRLGDGPLPAGARVRTNSRPRIDRGVCRSREGRGLRRQPVRRSTRSAATRTCAGASDTPRTEGSTIEDAQVRARYVRPPRIRGQAVVPS